MQKKLWAKIVFTREGVTFEKKYETEAEAKAFVEGFNECKKEIDPDDEFSEDYIATTDDQPATIES